MSNSQNYPVGIPGAPWGPAEKSAWLARQVRQRSYETDVLSAAATLGRHFEAVRYGQLDVDPARFPLIAYRSRKWQSGLPAVLLTGGVHGYETSGVRGALRFLERHAAAYEDRINLVAAPCVSPWAYEMIQRWNPQAIDPNRSFFADSPAQESAALMQLVAPIRDQILVHIDLHETTDTDESEFRPTLAARDGVVHQPGIIPDGFYVVDDGERPQTRFQNAVIAAVEKVTHIAPADPEGKIIGSPVIAPGVIHYPLKKLGLCAGMTDAPFKTTTEVYPDSPRATPEQCILAQVAATCAAIDYALSNPPA